MRKRGEAASHGRPGMLTFVLASTLLLAGCTASQPSAEEPKSPSPEPPTVAAATPPAVQPTVAPAQANSGVPFVVPTFEGPEPAPVSGGTTHRYPNPHSGNGDTPIPSAYQWIEFTVPTGWEVGDVYIGKNLGQPDEVALSFWTTAGVYPDPCRRGDSLIPLDLELHGHPDHDHIDLQNYPELGVSAQEGREASEPRSLRIEDPTDEEGTLALRIEVTVPPDLDVASCDDGVYRAWPGFDVGDQAHDNHIAGQTDIIFQVDVDRNPLLIDASFRRDSSAEDIEELYSVIGSIVMDRW